MSDRENLQGLDHAARRLREPVPASADFERRVLAAVYAVGPHTPSRAQMRGVRALTHWLIRPRPITMSPLVGLAAATAIVVLTSLAMRMLPSVDVHARATAMTAMPEPARARDVQFVLVAPGASHVALVGSFNDWDPAATPLRRTAAGGAWIVGVPLVAGRHQYAFIIDGDHWMADPVAAPAVEDDFGVPSSVVTVGETSS